MTDHSVDPDTADIQDGELGEAGDPLLGRTQLLLLGCLDPAGETISETRNKLHSPKFKLLGFRYYHCIHPTTSQFQL